VPELVRGSALMSDPSAPFWRVVEHLDYLLTLAWLCIMKPLADPRRARQIGSG
jgi:hypothetical protein